MLRSKQRGLLLVFLKKNFFFESAGEAGQVCREVQNPGDARLPEGVWPNDTLLFFL